MTIDWEGEKKYKKRYMKASKFSTELHLKKIN
jgi:hypothetical protein